MKILKINNFDIIKNNEKTLQNTKEDKNFIAKKTK